MPIPNPSRRRLAIARALMLLAAAVLYGSCRDRSPMEPTATLRVTSISPMQGSTTGGTLVTVAGTDFSSDATLMVGGVAATSISVQGTTAITALVGTRPTGGPADVVVTSGGRTAMLANAFAFIAPSGANRPPVVTGIRSVGSRAGQPSGFADVDEVITLVATATDVETPATALTYEWSGAGSFSGTGATVSWRAPATVSPTPAPMTVTVTAAESFMEGPVTHRNVSSGSFVLQIHDSQKEILDAGEDFLTLFSRSEVPSDQVLHNFSTTCDRGDGRAAEKVDVDRSRRDYVQDFSKFRIARLPPVTFNFGGACVAFGDPTRVRRADACSLFNVHWEINYIRADDFHRIGDRETTDGIDHVTAVLENNRWLLCHSDFRGSSTNLRSGLTRFIVW